MQLTLNHHPPPPILPVNMPIPTVEDLLAFKHLDSQEDLVAQILQTDKYFYSAVSGASSVGLQGYVNERNDFSYEEVNLSLTPLQFSSANMPG